MLLVLPKNMDITGNCEGSCLSPSPPTAFNHTSCSAAFKSSEYSSLENINSEACEQTNSALRRVAHSTTFMSPSMYMRSLTLFLADLNISANKKKWNSVLIDVLHNYQTVWASFVSSCPSVTLSDFHLSQSLAVSMISAMLHTCSSAVGIATMYNYF